MKSITAAELKQRMEECELPLLLDIRDPWEFDICSIHGSRNVPIEALQQFLEDLDRQQEIVVICHHGIRSYQVAGYLDSLGFGQVANLEMGVDGWAMSVEPEMTRY